MSEIENVIAEVPSLAAEAPRADASPLSTDTKLPLLPLAISAASGFIALSYEILWYRAVSYVSWSVASAFGLLLGAYLFGIAFGALFAGRLCRNHVGDGSGRELRLLAMFTALANLVGFLVVPAMARLVLHHTWPTVLPLVGVAAALLGAIFPLVSHFGIPADERAGVRLSYVYLANIAGSAAGSLLTGLVLLDHFSYSTIALGLAITGVALAAALAYRAERAPARKAAALAIAVFLTMGLFSARPVAFDHLYERLLYRDHFDGSSFAEVIENKSGVITVTSDGVVYGGGAYDGRLNISLAHDENGIVRAYGVGALAPEPKRILMIGLSSGSWAQVICHLPKVESMEIVEINGGYLQLISHHPEVASVLTNPKVHITIDDGRRWLLRHPDERFDVIVQNTTWHWRAHITALESEEYLAIVRRHLVPGGLFYFNTTESAEVQRTAALAFPYAIRVYNFMAVSDAPLVFDDTRWKASLDGMVIDGIPAFDRTTEAGRHDYDIALERGRPDPDGHRFEGRSSVLSRTLNAKVVTDDNMAPEFEEILHIQAPP